MIYQATSLAVHATSTPLGPSITRVMWVIVASPRPPELARLVDAREVNERPDMLKLSPSSLPFLSSIVPTDLSTNRGIWASSLDVFVFQPSNIAFSPFTSPSSNKSSAHLINVLGALIRYLF